MLPTIVLSKVTAIGPWKFGGTQAIYKTYNTKEYKLKLRTEIRLADSAQVEMDIKLMRGFTDFLALAHSRKGSYLSEKKVGKMFEKDLFTDDELKNPEKLNRKIQQAAVLNVFSGIAEQEAFTAAITNLGLKHDILRQPAIQALKRMSEFVSVAPKYLAKFEQKS